MIVYIRNSLAIPAEVMENLKVRAAEGVGQESGGGLALDLDLDKRAEIAGRIADRMSTKLPD